jgi:hypothetical protein
MWHVCVCVCARASVQLTVATKIKTVPQAERKQVLQEALAKLKFPSRFQLPLDQRYEIVRRSEKRKCGDSS